MAFIQMLIEHAGSILHLLGELITTKGSLAIGTIGLVTNYFRSRKTRSEALRSEALHYRQEAYETLLEMTFNRTDDLGKEADKRRFVWDGVIEENLDFDAAEIRKNRRAEIQVALRASNAILEVIPEYNSHLQKAYENIHHIDQLSEIQNPSEDINKERAETYVNLRSNLGMAREQEIKIIEAVKSELNSLKPVKTKFSVFFFNYFKKYRKLRIVN